MNFEQYLKRQGLSPKTINSYQSTLKTTIKQLERSSVELEDFNYSDVLDLIRTKQRFGNSSKSINGGLGVLRQYFDYLILEGLKTTNPAANVIVRGTRRNKIYNLIDESKLIEVYKKQDSITPKQCRDKVILGLLFFQGLSVEELSRLNTFNIDLDEGLITIPEGSKSSGRTISLLSKQTMAMIQYLMSKRKELNPVKADVSSKLILSEGSDDRLKQSLTTLLIRLKNQYPVFETWNQIRASVISSKLTSDNLRQQQHYFGFKHISSIERYLDNDVESLKGDVDRCFIV